MLTDIEIAQRAKIKPIEQIAKKAGLYLAMKEEVDIKTDLLKKFQAPIIAYVPRTALLSEIGKYLKPPEDSLTSLRLLGDNLEIRGDTKSSSELMERLGKSEYFSNVRLSSPVMKDQKTGKERFVVEITVKNLDTAPKQIENPEENLRR